MKIYRFMSLIFVFVLILSACNLPSSKPTQQVNPDAIFTAAAETVVAQLTQSALLVPTNPPVATQPAPTSEPTITAQPQSTTAPAATIAPTTSCDAAQFITDVSIPDGTTFDGNATFTKTWRLKNIGACTWSSSYSLVYDSGDAMGGPTTQSLTDTVLPGGSVDISIGLQAPASAGTYRGYWGITNSAGQRMPVSGGSNGKSFYVEIKVGNGSSTDDGKFAVTSVGFSVDRNGTSCQYTVTAVITTNQAGDVNYTWMRSNNTGTTTTSMTGVLSFAKADSQGITFSWAFTGDNQWVDLYIDKPNHQQFGRAQLACP